MRRAAAWLLALGAAAAQGQAPGAQLVVGSKTFTESVVLGELVRLEAERHGVALVHRRAVGGTRILWRGLLEGDLDLYPDYTGTLAEELLHETDVAADVDALRPILAERGLGLSQPFGFDNTYALGMREPRAAELGIGRISDLAAHRDLRMAFSNEFMDRSDGWPGLRAAYALPQAAQGMNHDLAYRALAAGSVA